MEHILNNRHNISELKNLVHFSPLLSSPLSLSQVPASHAESLSLSPSSLGKQQAQPEKNGPVGPQEDRVGGSAVLSPAVELARATSEVRGQHCPHLSGAIVVGRAHTCPSVWPQC